MPAGLEDVAGYYYDSIIYGESSAGEGIPSWAQDLRLLSGPAGHYIFGKSQLVCRRRVHRSRSLAYVILRNKYCTRANSR